MNMLYKMKPIFLFSFLLMSASVAFSQTLFTYGSNVVSKEEFLKAYNKNKAVVTDKEASLNEYLDLYTKFKLKVKAAQDLGIDTLPQLQYDLQSFRTQVEDSYMNNEQSVDALTNEAFERMQKDVHAYHFFVPIMATTTADDTIKAYNALKEISKQLSQGKTNYSEIATDVSSKIFTVKHGGIGFITAFSVPYEYENVIYKLAVGENSNIYRSKKGIHIFKNIEERKSAGKWRIAQILFAFAPGEDVTNTPALKAKADSVYTVIKNGSDFGAMAKKYSDDKMTYAAGGELPEFGTGKFQPQFEKEFLKLKNNGDVSSVFVTSFGYHIVKRLEQTPTPLSKDAANYLMELKQRVQQDGRINTAKEKFAQEILSKLGYKKSAAIKEADLFKYADSVTKNPNAIATKFPIGNKTVFSFNKTNFTGANWLGFIKEYKTNGELYQGENNATLLTKFINTSALDFYKKNLENYNADFKYQMAEFKEGNMLFEIMERKVWSKAANDNVGLQKYYETNKAKYKWAASATVILFNCNNEATAKKAIADLKAGADWKKVTEDANNTIQTDSSRYELTQIPVKEGTVLNVGNITEPVVNALDGTASFVKVIKLYNANEQRSFDEAKGLIINDYQTVVEEQWLSELKKKYPVKVNDSVFKSLFK
jgi:peptidyl-prolyl cis-trans isomerase SurA